MASRRALHFVFKVGDRKRTATFYRDVLQMKFLRHEEFEEGCKASCNGPYDGKWSKSMVGYGPEDDSFVIELTYNYGLGSYKLGNDLRGITIHSKQAPVNAKLQGYEVNVSEGRSVLLAPDGYPFFIEDKEPTGDPVKIISLSCSSLSRSKKFWNGKLGMRIYSETKNSAMFGYADNQCKLELVEIAEPIDRGTAYGRIAFSCPAKELAEIEKTMKDAGEKILTPLVSLDTPGKATVHVVILADPDGHEICFVGDEGFRELSQVDPSADKLLEESLAADKSNEWYAKKKKPKPAAT